MNIFFGAGKLGKKYYIFWRECGIALDYFADNNPTLWYKRIEGIEVIPPEKLKDFTENLNILITCRDWEPIWLQLKELGMRDYQIKVCNTTMGMLTALRYLPSLQLPLKTPDDSQRKVLFLLDFGLTLGGVEFWSLNTAKKLRELGWNAHLLLSNETQATMSECEDEYMIKAVCTENLTEWEKLVCLIAPMLQYRSIICNFAGGYNLMAASLIKKSFQMKYRVIAVIHNDEEEYYQSYMDAEPYLDKCLIISNKMGTEMIKRGFPKEKLMYLPWKISCNDFFSHCYSQQNEPLRIGYAGRVVIAQKRSDLLLTVAKKLEERGIDFRMEIAGTGSYEEELRLQIQTAGLENKARCLGMLKDVRLFWLRQDIMITCSEWEGHSISQCEAMAAGAVPIITDTSGARDDVEDGINGYIVNIGDIDHIVERICYLYSHREQLPILGERAHKTILERNKACDFQKLWESILLS